MGNCAACPSRVSLTRMGLNVDRWDYVVALAGNPNTGKSTVFNALTGLRQHTGNWPGKTVARAEGSYSFGGKRYKLVDLPGTYSLLSASQDEQIARDFILFGQPDCTIVVTDATCLERNLNLVLQVLEISDKVVVCVNLLDEARRKAIEVDVRALARDLGVPAVATAARLSQGLSELTATVAEMVGGECKTSPHHVCGDGAFQRAVGELVPLIEQAAAGLPNARWVAMRLLDGDHRVRTALYSGELSGAAARQRAPAARTPMLVASGDAQGIDDRGWRVADGLGGSSFVTHSPSSVVHLQMRSAGSNASPAELVLARADALQRTLHGNFRDELVVALYHDAETIARRVVRRAGDARLDFDQKIDRLLTSRVWGLPLMILLLGAVFWITITGANYPSKLLADGLFWFEAWASAGFDAAGAPAWLTGVVWHGTYRGLAWVVAVMLPPMAIFFPCFTILEDLGYLPRVAFNLDRLFKKAGAHGKQALTMSMGFGCNAAGITACRVIDSPRERLIAILTNNFVPCNGRFPTLILLATIFVAARFPSGFASVAAAGAVVMVVMIGVLFTLIVSAVLSRTVLRGEASAFTLELPPYRRPNIIRILHTSLIDRTIFVLGRAVLLAAPAGAVIWILGNVTIDGLSLARHVSDFLDPLGSAVGLDGVILLTYIIAIPANEIVVPTMIMVYMGAGAMTEDISVDGLQTLLVEKNGWTLLTAVNLMLFSLLHNPCATTIVTMWKETRSLRWTTLGALMPLGIAFAVTFVVAQAVRLAALL